MLRTTEHQTENLLTLRAEGVVGKDDYDLLTPVLAAQIARWGTVNLLVDVHELNFVTLPALWQDLRLDIEHWRDFDRIAVVSDDSQVAKAVAAVSNLVVPAEVRHFSRPDEADALNWLRAIRKTATP